jgi:hypothetical protein
MKKVETPSDTVFVQGLKEILSSDSVECDHDTDRESVDQDPTTRPRLNFSANSRDADKVSRGEIIVRVIAGVAALGLLIYFVVTVTSKM